MYPANSPSSNIFFRMPKMSLKFTLMTSSYSLSPRQRETYRPHQPQHRHLDPAVCDDIQPVRFEIDWDDRCRLTQVCIRARTYCDFRLMRNGAFECIFYWMQQQRKKNTLKILNDKLCNCSMLVTRMSVSIGSDPKSRMVCTMVTLIDAGRTETNIYVWL